MFIAFAGPAGGSTPGESYLHLRQARQLPQRHPEFSEGGGLHCGLPGGLDFATTFERSGRNAPWEFGSVALNPVGESFASRDILVGLAVGFTVSRGYSCSACKCWQAAVRRSCVTFPTWRRLFPPPLPSLVFLGGVSPPHPFMKGFWMRIRPGHMKRIGTRKTQHSTLFGAA